MQVEQLNVLKLIILEAILQSNKQIKTIKYYLKHMQVERLNVIKLIILEAILQSHNKLLCFQ